MILDAASASAYGLGRYLSLVADALDLTGDAYCLDLGPPVAAYLALDWRLPGLPARDAALLWDEYNGWAGGLETTGAGAIAVLSYLGGDVLPSPRVVARCAQELFTDAGRCRAEPPGFRTADTRDDLAQRLAAYAPPLSDWRLGRAVNR